MAVGETFPLPLFGNNQELFNEILRKGLKRFLRKQTGKRPIILPLTIEI